MFKYSLLIVIIYFQSTEEIPVLMWESNQEVNLSLDKYSPLKINVHDFKTIVYQIREKRLPIIVFLEDNLSSEDLIIRNDDGGTIYLGLCSFMNSFNSYFIPDVDNPFEIIEDIASPMNKIDPNFHNMINLEEVAALVVDLKIGKTDESRLNMLKKHDLTIVKMQSEFLHKHHHIFSIFTARYPSWVPEYSDRHKSKKLLETELDSNNPPESKVVPIVDDKSLLLVIKGNSEFSTDNGKTFSNVTLSKQDLSTNDDEITLLLGESIKVKFSITFGSDGFWRINEVTIDDKHMDFEAVEVPMNFSYHCAKFELSNKTIKTILRVPGFQIQPFTEGQDQQNFGDAFDCVGFMTIPICSGIFVVTILLMILFYGIISMMDIQTRDGFDDPRGNLFKPFVENN